MENTSCLFNKKQGKPSLNLLNSNSVCPVVILAFGTLFSVSWDLTYFIQFCLVHSSLMNLSFGFIIISSGNTLAKYKFSQLQHFIFTVLPTSPSNKRFPHFGQFMKIIFPPQYFLFRQTFVCIYFTRPHTWCQAFCQTILNICLYFIWMHTA